MKTKQQLWLELLVAAVTADSEGAWTADRLAVFVDSLVLEAETRGFIASPMTEVQALRSLEACVRGGASTEDLRNWFAKLDEIRKGY